MVGRLLGAHGRCDEEALRASLHLCHLSFEQLSIVLYELAFFDNLRPLTQGDGEDLLTPAHPV